MMHYNAKEQTEPLTEEQKAAIGGYSNLKAMTDVANRAARSHSVPIGRDIEGYQSAQWRAVVPSWSHIDDL